MNNMNRNRIKHLSQLLDEYTYTSLAKILGYSSTSSLVWARRYGKVGMSLAYRMHTKCDIPAKELGLDL